MGGRGEDSKVGTRDLNGWQIGVLQNSFERMIVLPSYRKKTVSSHGAGVEKIQKPIQLRSHGRKGKE